MPTLIAAFPAGWLFSRSLQNEVRSERLTFLPCGLVLNITIDPFQETEHRLYGHCLEAVRPGYDILQAECLDPSECCRGSVVSCAIDNQVGRVSPPPAMGIQLFHEAASKELKRVLVRMRLAYCRPDVSEGVNSCDHITSRCNCFDGSSRMRVRENPLFPVS